MEGYSYFKKEKEKEENWLNVSSDLITRILGIVNEYDEITLGKIITCLNEIDNNGQLTMKKFCKIMDPSPSKIGWNREGVSTRLYSSKTDYRNIEFESYDEAKQVLDNLEYVISKYGFASVKDFYDLAGIEDHNYENNNFGWYQFSSEFFIKKSIFGNKYSINLPKVKYLGN